jgi:hypothetical protein
MREIRDRHEHVKVVRSLNLVPTLLCYEQCCEFIWATGELADLSDDLTGQAFSSASASAM